jgi:hypothetical protein
MAKAKCGSAILWRTARVLAAVLVFVVVSTPAAAQATSDPRLSREGPLLNLVTATGKFARRREGDSGAPGRPRKSRRTGNPKTSALRYRSDAWRRSDAMIVRTERHRRAANRSAIAPGLASAPNLLIATAAAEPAFPLHLVEPNPCLIRPTAARSRKVRKPSRSDRRRQRHETTDAPAPRTLAWHELSAKVEWQRIGSWSRAFSRPP